MLVTLGTNQAIGANSSHTYTYSPQSVQKVFLKLDDDAAIALGTTRVTVQIGSKTICNGVSLTGLLGLTTLQNGYATTVTDRRFVLNFGSHQLNSNENLYVTVSSVLALSAVDCSAIVDTPGEYNPLKLTEYSDNTFTSEYVYTAINYINAGTVVDEDNYVCEIRTATESSAPNFISANNWYSMVIISADASSNFGLLVNKNIPESTTFNYSSSAATDSILVVQAMPKGRQGKAKAIQSQQIAMKTLPPSLR
jgi:hypothetical protein